MKIVKTSIGNYVEIDPIQFGDSWPQVEILLKTLHTSFRFENDDVKVKMIYKPGPPDNYWAPTLGLKIYYLKLEDKPEDLRFTREGGVLSSPIKDGN